MAPVKVPALVRPRSSMGHCQTALLRVSDAFDVVVDGLDSRLPAARRAAALCLRNLAFCSEGKVTDGRIAPAQFAPRAFTLHPQRLRLPPSITLLIGCPHARLRALPWAPAPGELSGQAARSACSA